MKEKQLWKKSARKKSSGGGVGLWGAEIVSGVDSYPSLLNFLTSSPPPPSYTPLLPPLFHERRISPRSGEEKKLPHGAVSGRLSWECGVRHVELCCVWEICANLLFLFLCADPRKCLNLHHLHWGCKWSELLLRSIFKFYHLCWVYECNDISSKYI